MLQQVRRAGALVASASASMRNFVPPPAPAPPPRYSSYGAGGRQDVAHAPIGTSTFNARFGKKPLRAEGYDEDLEGTMLDIAPKPASSPDTSHRLPGPGGNSVPQDELPPPPFNEYPNVLRDLRTAVFKLTMRKGGIRADDPHMVSPKQVKVLPISLGHVAQEISSETKKLLRDPLFSGLEKTLRNSSLWFEVSADGLYVRLTPEAHQFGLEKVASHFVPIPEDVQRREELFEQKQKAKVTQKTSQQLPDSEEPSTVQEACSLGFPQTQPKGKPVALQRVPSADSSSPKEPMEVIDETERLDEGPPPSTSLPAEDHPKETAQTETTLSRRPVLLKAGRLRRVTNVEQEIFNDLVDHATIEAPKILRERGVNVGGTYKSVISSDGKLVGVINLAHPPLTQKEIDYVLPMQRAMVAIQAYYYPDKSIVPRPPPPRIIPKDVEFYKVPEFEEFDKLYADYSRIPPSEMCYAMMEFVPTFFVELRHVMRFIPPAALRVIAQQERFGHDGRLVMQRSIFRRYPMICSIKGGKNAEKAVIRLNYSEFPCLKKHPRFGMADKPLFMFNLEREGHLSPIGVITTAGGDVEDEVGASPQGADGEAPNGESGAQALNQAAAGTVTYKSAYREEAVTMNRLFKLFIKYLPRYPDGPEEKRYEFFNLNEWIDGFAEEDREFVRSVPEMRIVRMINDYNRIFQLSSSGPKREHMFVPVEDYYGSAGIVIAKKGSPSPTTPNAEPISEEFFMRISGARLDIPQAPPPPVEKTSEDVEPEKEAFADVSAEGTEEVPGVVRMDEDTDEEMRNLDNFELAYEDDKETAARVKGFNDAVVDEMIGVDDILLGNKDDSTQTATNNAQTDKVLSEDMDEGQKEIVSDDTTEIDSNAGGALPDFEKLDGALPPGEFEALLIRRLPAPVAPRCLCDMDDNTSCNPDLLTAIRELIPLAPGSLGPNSFVFLKSEIAFRGMIPIRNIWRWIALENIYNTLSSDFKKQLRQYKGLANFLRLHGRLFEVSEDSRYVISHDPTGELPPWLPWLQFLRFQERLRLPADFDSSSTDKVVTHGEELQNNWARALGGKNVQVPRTRMQLQLLDPKNPLLHSSVLYEEMAAFLPDHPVSYHTLLKRIPPLLRAAMPANIMRGIRSARHLTVLSRGPSLYVMRASLGQVEETEGVLDATSVATEDQVVYEIRNILGSYSATVTMIWVKMSCPSRNYIKAEYQTVDRFFRMHSTEFGSANILSDRAAGGAMRPLRKQIVWNLDSTGPNGEIPPQLIPRSQYQPPT